jgi:signal transduction histidine kinase
MYFEDNEQEKGDETNKNKRYKAYFVGTSDQQKKEFKNSKCVMIISVGQKYHENGELQAAVSLIDRHFGYCNILVCDTLQRHSLAIEQNKSEEELAVLARNAGDKWIKRNMQYISTLTIPYEISRWDDWINKDRYRDYHEKVLKLYNSDDIYKKVVEQIAQEFLSRRNNIKNYNLALDLCIKFLLEESAVACLWVESGYKYDVYPTRSNLAMIMAYNKLVQNEVDFGASSLRLNIKKFADHTINKLKTEEYKNIATNYILTHAPGHIYWKNLEGVFLGCNVEHAKYFGFDNPIDIVGKINTDFLDEETSDYISDIDLKVMSTGQEHVIEECVNGTQYFLSKKVPLRDYDNKIIGLLGTSINITEQKNLESVLEKTVQELEKALVSKESFIKNMNHEIRTPMQLILNGPQILKDNFNKFTDQDKLYFLDGMIKATKRLNDLVTNLLDMSKFKEGKFVLNVKGEDFKLLCEELIQDFSLMYKNRIKHDILFDSDVVVECDKIRIHQVLRNLLMNSIRYSGESSKISITILICDENQKNYIKCSVKDEGVGIPEEEKNLIFDPFVGSSVTKEIPGGVGLGLTISKEIIQSHNGRIWVDDIKDGEVGARISFIIPL